VLFMPGYGVLWPIFLMVNNGACTRMGCSSRDTCELSIGTAAIPTPAPSAEILTGLASCNKVWETGVGALAGLQTLNWKVMLVQTGRSEATFSLKEFLDEIHIPLDMADELLP